MKIAAHDLGWAARGRPIVEGITLEVASGETLGLIGPNGSGKSTLLKLFAGIAARARGKVSLDGTALSRMNRRDIARRIAFVEQQAQTTEALRVQDAVELGRTPWLSPLAPFGAQDAAICAEALARVGMADMATRSWTTLSGGERQRVHIARALAQRPQVMLLDEPTNHLDIHHQLSLLRLVSDLPVTVVIALHDLNQALGCDRLAVLEGGRLAALGPPREVLSADRLARIFRVGARTLTDPTDGVTQFRFHCLEDQP